MYLKQVRKEAMEIPFKEVLLPSMPVDELIMEAENTKYHVQMDRELFVEKGYDASKIDKIEYAIQFLQMSQSDWLVEFNNKKDVELKWKDISEKANSLHRSIIHDMRFGYRNNPELLSKLSRIAEGNSNADLVQDFSDMVELANAYPEPLKLINMDFEKFEQANDYKTTIRNVLGEVNGVRISGNKEKKEVRDKAYTYLKRIIDEIRDYGKYIFWQDEEKMKVYSSNYRRKSRSKPKNEV